MRDSSTCAPSTPWNSDILCADGATETQQSSDTASAPAVSGRARAIHTTLLLRGLHRNFYPLGYCLRLVWDALLLLLRAGGE